MEAVEAAWAVLLLGPPAAWLALRAALWAGDGVTRATLACAAVLLAATVLARWCGIEFRDPVLNLAALGAAYLAYALLAFAAPLAGASPRLARRPMLAAAGLVVVFAPMAAGCFFATIGALALVFVIGDAAEPPVTSAVRADGLTCEVRRWSGGPDDDSYGYALYLDRPALPLRLRMAHGPLTQAQFSRLSAGAPADSCDPGRRSASGL